MQPVNRRPQWKRLFANRSFSLLFTGQLISSLGDIVYDLALMWFVYGATGSAVKTGGVVLAGMASQLVFGLPAGALVDRWNRKLTMVISDTVRGLLVLSLALAMALGGGVVLWHVYLVGFCLHTVSLLFGPARQAVLPDIVGADLLLSANVAANMIGQLLSVVGTAAGGAVVVFLGAGGALTFDAVTFFVSAVLILIIEIPDTRRVSERRLTMRGLARDIGEALTYMRRDAIVQFVVTVVMLANFGSLMYASLTPMFVKDVLHAGPETYGFVNTAMVLGSLAGGLLVGTAVQRLSPAATVTAGLGVAGLSAALLGFAHSPLLAMGLFGVMGLALVFNQTPLYTHLQTTTPGHLRGRVFTTFGLLANLVGPVAVSLGTLLADRFSVGAVYLAGGAVVVIGGIITGSRPGLLRQPDAPEQEAGHGAQHAVSHAGH